MLKFFSEKSVKTFFIFAAVLILLIFLHFVKILSPIENLFFKITAPIQRVAVSLGTKVNGVKDFWQGRAELSVAREELLRLKTENSSLILENGQLKLMERENQDLRQALNFVKSNYLDHFVAAEVIGRDTPEINTLILNKGTKDNPDLRVGLPVVVGQGILVGKVVKVTGETSTVLLLTDSNSKVTAMISNPAQTIGVVEGEHGLSVRMSLIPQSETVKEDDVVMTAGLEQNVPKGLLIGKVLELNKDAGQETVFQSVIIEPAVSYGKISTVLILY